jgi:pimeloyl-ACP methyl ester carboxylesterase
MVLQVVEAGDGAPLVLLVHGVIDRGRSFARVMELLAGECTVCTYDRRGYGDASGPGIEADVAAHVADILTVLDGRRAVVVGHSFGGVSVLGAAVQAPELVDAVVLYETAIAWAPGWDDVAMRTVLAAEDPVDAGLRLMLGDRVDTFAPERVERWRQLGAAFVAEERSVRVGPPPFDLRAVRAPVVYGAGMAEIVRPVVAHLDACVPHLEVVDFPGVGHNAHLEAPEQFAAMVRRGIALARR